MRLDNKGGGSTHCGASARFFLPLLPPSLPTTQNKQRLCLATTAAGRRLASTALLRQRRCLPSALRALRALKALRTLVYPVGPVVPVVLVAIAALSQTPQSLCASSPNLGERWLDGTAGLWSVPTCQLHKTACGRSSPKLGEVPLGGGVCQF